MQLAQATTQLLGHLWPSADVLTRADFVEISHLLHALLAVPHLTETARRCVASIDVSWCVHNSSSVVVGMAHRPRPHSALIEQHGESTAGFFFSSVSRDEARSRVEQELSNIRESLHNLALETALHHPSDQLLRSLITALRKRFDQFCR